MHFFKEYTIKNLIHIGMWMNSATSTKTPWLEFMKLANKKIWSRKIWRDTKKQKISNHLIESSGVSPCGSWRWRQQLIKITGHNNSNSIKSYLQLEIRSSVTVSNSSTNVLFEHDSVQNITNETGLLQNLSNVSFQIAHFNLLENNISFQFRCK